jgi:hypothetical protein
VTQAVTDSEPLVPADLDLTHRPAEESRAVAWLLARAAHAGDTVVRAPRLLRALAGTLELAADDPAVIAALEAAVGSGEVVIVPDPGGRADRFGLPGVVAAEEDLAEHVERLLVTAEDEGGAVVVVPDLPGTRLPPELVDARRTVAADGRVVVEHAERLGLAQARTLVAGLPDGGRLVLVGDPERVAAPGPGRFLADLLAARVATVRTPDLDPRGGLAAFGAALRAGTLTAPDAADRSVVVVPAPDDAAVLHRVAQLVAVSIPRAFGVDPTDVLVLTPLHRGVAGCRSLGEALAAQGLAARVAAVGEAGAERAPAVVLALPAEAAGVLNRAVLLTAATRAERHLSIVSAAGESVVRTAVTRGARRPHTRLAELLTLGD